MRQYLRREGKRLKSLQNINWVEESEIYALIDDLRERYRKDPIKVISYNPIATFADLRQ